MSDKILINVLGTESLVDAFCKAMELHDDGFYLRNAEIERVDTLKYLRFHPILTKAIDRAFRQATKELLKHEAIYKRLGMPNHHDEIEALLKKKPAKKSSKQPTP